MLETVRIPEEKVLCDQLRDWLAADTILQLMVQSGVSGGTGSDKCLWPIGNSLAGLREILDQVVERLSMQDWEINFFLQGGTAPLATSRITITERGEEAEIIFSAKLLDSLSPDAIRAVAAHELAHVCFGHTRLQLCIDWLDLAAKQGRLYALSNLYGYWRQLAEISADRASLLAVDDPGSSLALLARQKIEGFTLHLDTKAFLAEAEEALATGTARPGRNSHPPLEIRALAMEHFRKSSFWQRLREKTGGGSDDSLPAITALTEHLKISPASQEQFLEFTFLMAAGNYLIQADAEIHNSEVHRLRDILARLLHAPEEAMLCLQDGGACKACLREIGGRIVDSCPAITPGIFELLCSLVVQDGRIAQAEKNALEQIAYILKIPDETMARIILKVLRQEFHPTLGLGALFS